MDPQWTTPKSIMGVRVISKLGRSRATSPCHLDSRRMTPRRRAKNIIAQI